MIKEFVYEMGDYSLYCEGGSEIVGLEVYKHITVSSYRGGGSNLTIPDTMQLDGEDMPVTAIGKKAFLGCASLRQISIPSTVTMIDDWAFAQCDHLKTVIIRNSSLPAERIMENLTVGTGVFEDCNNLEYICLGNEEQNTLAALLGAVINRMKAEYLIKATDIGTDNWFVKWDQCLADFLDEDDEEGYLDVVLCGEEDFGVSASEYVTDKRKRKASLCLLRLAHDDLLSYIHRNKFTDYLLKHTKGCQTEEAWQVILSDFSENADYYKIFAELGCVTEDNIDDMLIDMGEKYAEAKAFLIGFKQDRFGNKDVFSMFEL